VVVGLGHLLCCPRHPVGFPTPGDATSMSDLPPVSTDAREENITMMESSSLKESEGSCQSSTSRMSIIS
jgi:hypothetical protein